MKKLISLALVAMFATTSIYAQNQQQGQRRERPSAEQQVEQMTKQLDLNKKQQDELTKLFKEQEKQERPSSREQMQERMQAMEKKIEGILNKEQIGKYKEMQEQRRKNQGNRRKRQ